MTRSSEGDVCVPGGERRKSIISTARLRGVHQFPGITEFPPTIKADPIRPLLDREYATQVTVMAPKGKLENPEQGIHRSCSRLRS